jgi:hypothetical protein
MALSVNLIGTCGNPRFRFHLYRLRQKPLGSLTQYLRQDIAASEH